MNVINLAKRSQEILRSELGFIYHLKLPKGRAGAYYYFVGFTTIIEYNYE